MVWLISSDEDADTFIFHKHEKEVSNKICAVLSAICPSRLKGHFLK